MNNPIDRMSPLLKFLHLAVLAGFAIAQPLYDLLAAQAEFFVVRQSPRMDIVFTVLLVSIVVPLGVLLLTVIPGAVSKAAQRLIFLFVVAALVFCFALVAIRQNDLASGYLAFALSAVIAFAASALYRLATGVRTLVTFMSPAILVFPIVFLMSGNISVLRQPPELVVQAASGVADADDGQYPPVIMILFDELSLNALLGSDGKLDAVRYPSFTALAGTSTWYSNATTVAPVTNYAVPAILSGRYPDTEALPVAAKYPQTLFSLLRGTHTLNIRETVTRLCPTQSCRPGAWSGWETTGQLVLDLAAVYGHMALPAQFSHWLPPLGHKWGGFVKAGNTQAIKDEYRAMESEVRDALAENLVSDRTRDLERFLDGIAPRAEGKPPLHFLHLLVPHRPWSYYPSGVMYTGGEGGRVTGMDRADVYWEANQDLVDQAYQRYLMQVGLVDTWLGRIVQKLEASDLFEDALFIVASDHGASFVAGDAYRKLTPSNYESVLPVPLFIKLPGQDVGRIDDSNVEITDLLPTIAGLLGVELTEAVDGLPIGSPAVAKRNTKRMYDFYSRWEHKPLDVDAELPGRAGFIAQRIALFGEGGEGSLYAFGPHRDIVGRAVAGFEVVPADASVSIDQASLLQEVDVNGGYLPGLVTGSLLGAAEPPSPWLVLALNGVIAASAPLYQDAAGRWAYAGLLPESGFTAGHNVVELFFVERGGGGVVLGAAGSSGVSPFWLEKTDSGEVVAYEGAVSTLPIVPLAVHGYVDTSLTLERSLKVSGWAINPQSKEAVARLLVFANGRGVAMASHNRLVRPDILQHHGVAGAGFSVRLPRTLLQDSDRLEIRVIGVNADGSAGELGYIERFEWRPGRE